MVMDQEKLIETLINAGAASVGCADMAPVPFAASRGLTTGISITFPFTHAHLARRPGLITADPEYIEAYYDFCSRLDPMVEAGVELLRAAGHQAEGYGYYTFFDRTGDDMDPSLRLTAYYQHKTTATRAGLGWIGRMGVLVTREFGPHIWLATILTDAKMTTASPITEARCGNCRRCVEACPAGAIKGAAWNVGQTRDDLVDIEKCQAHRRLRGQGLRAPMCGLCLAACPFGAGHANRAGT
ncbi:hypothetical protein C4J81_02880 [Deltaproteobacteria bacterium Smac51]|nr:hypothetical protein C4J81_02880 [Deltaproteobacteria bacterium Smac51]